nr:uncharacterized protein LOC103410250 [Malus domestica]
MYTLTEVNLKHKVEHKILPNLAQIVVFIFQSTKKMGSETFLEVILAIILPPVGVFLRFGCGVEFWICLLLTILGYIPGIIIMDDGKPYKAPRVSQPIEQVDKTPSTRRPPVSRAASLQIMARGLSWASFRSQNCGPIASSGGITGSLSAKVYKAK